MDGLRRLRFGGLIVVALVAASCSSDGVQSTAPTDVLPTSTTAVAGQEAPTTPESTAQVIDEAFLEEQANKSLDPDRPGAVMVVVFDAAGDMEHGSVGTDPTGATPAPADHFRVGSITKTFTALTVLTLVDDGLIDLDAPVTSYVSRLSIDDRITVRDALQHSSGLPDPFDVQPDLLSTLVDDPTRQWSPEDMVELVAAGELAFQPGERFAYSNTNYTVLGVLIEEVAGQPYHEAVRQRIIDPLAMSGTYLAGFEEGPAVFGGYIGFRGTDEPLDFEFTSIATASWASGGMVSTARDLHNMLSALFAGEIVAQDLVGEMTANPKDGLGIWAPEWTSQTPLLGHDGRIPGAGTFLVHAPETGATVFTVSNADWLRVSPATGAVAEAIGVPGVTIAAG